MKKIKKPIKIKKTESSENFKLLDDEYNLIDL